MSIQYYYRPFISMLINGGGINHEYIIATISFMYYHNLQAIQYRRDLLYVTLI